MSHNDDVVRQVFAMWEQPGLDSTLEAWRKHCWPDLVWWNSARGMLQGLDPCLQGIEQMYETLEIARLEVPVRTLDALADRIIVERSDNMYRADRSVIARVPVTGIIEFKDGRISMWRDYCDDWMTKLATGVELGPQSAP